ncbi:acyl-CoA dehydrogenase family protein [Mycolicibacterium sphagni]|uniref:Acyl-CoA dehydrogenase n=1 Tax=Mycolicibacterium sphagni TaxID=1786 RepID=A0A255DC26_9MYCO|nr:acyl-CoA dehydrogenase family protein [Mycolicibacterium sphagni]OYN76171.1 acyl-CoA dehydrogenase [Mycolicibacterium sphagni]
MDNESFQQVLSAVRHLVRTEVIPCEDEIEETDAIPPRVRTLATDMGLFGYALPAEHGGLGLSLSEDIRLAFEFGYTVPAFRSMFGTNNGIAGQVIAKFGTEQQRQLYLPRLAAGAIASFALTEAEAGSDPAGLRATARRQGSDWVINGRKRFITNAALADLLVVFARTDPNAKGAKGISAFIVDTTTPGVAIGPKDRKMGQAGAWTSEVSFDDVRVDASRLLGGAEGGGFAAALTVLSRGRVHVAALCVGLAQRICDESVAYAAMNKQGGRPIGEYQLVQAMLAESHAELLAGRALVVDVATRYDAGEDTTVGPSSAKLFCSEMVNRVADRGVQVHGGMGYMRTTPVERFFRDARLYRIYEGTSEIQKLVIGRELVRKRQSSTEGR